MINERITALIKAVSNGNKRAFSKLVGVTPTVIENIVGTRQGKPGYDLLEKIAFSIENVNLDWILTGRGSMICSECSPATSPQEMPGEASAYYKMYKEKDEENKVLLKENAILQERLRMYESEQPDFKKTVKNVSTKGNLSYPNPDATSAGAPLKK